MQHCIHIKVMREELDRIQVALIATAVDTSPNCIYREQFVGLIYPIEVHTVDREEVW